MRQLAWLLVVIALTSCTRAEEDKLGLKPKNPPADAAPAPKAAPGPGAPGGGAAANQPCPALAVSVSKAGAWIGDGQNRRFAAACGGEQDIAAVAAELCARGAARGTAGPAANATCSAIEVAADSGVAYQQLISIMDAAVAAGLPDVGLTEPGKLSVTFPAAATAADKLAASCGKPSPPCQRAGTTASAPAAPGTPTPVTPPAAPGVPGPSIVLGSPIALPPAASKEALRTAPIVTVTAVGDVSLDRKVVATGKQARAGKKIEALDKALAARPAADPAARGVLILQADKATDVELLNRIIQTAQGAGFDNIMFAVDRKP